MTDPRPLMLIGAGMFLCACVDEARSCELDTDAILMRATVSNTASGVEVEIELEAAGEDGTGTPLALCPDGDRLEVNGMEPELVRILGHIYYSIEFESSEPSYELALIRDGHDNVMVTVDLPPEFEITAPLEDSSNSRGAGLDVTWTPDWPGQQIALAIADEIGSTCIDGLGVQLEVDDLGAYTVPAGTLSGASGESCEVAVSLTRSLEVGYPAALHDGGSIVALVRRRRPFTSVD